MLWLLVQHAKVRERQSVRSVREKDEKTHGVVMHANVGIAAVQVK